MTDPAADLLGAFETHSVEAIRAALDRGADPAAPIRGKAPLTWLIEMYTRSSRLADCVRVLLDAGATLDNDDLLAILLDDADRLQSEVGERRFDLGCAYTSMQGVTALHVSAEYNAVACARALLQRGIDADVRADTDSDGLGGQTPIFHTVNSNRNHCRPMMELLVEAGADLELRLRGLRWGVGFDWETTIFDVTPISYAQCGLYPQFHRTEEQVYANVDFLYRRRYGRSAPATNVPNRYVTDEFDLATARRSQVPEDPSKPV